MAMGHTLREKIIRKRYPPYFPPHARQGTKNTPHPPLRLSPGPWSLPNLDTIHGIWYVRNIHKCFWTIWNPQETHLLEAWLPDVVLLYRLLCAVTLGVTLEITSWLGKGPNIWWLWIGDGVCFGLLNTLSSISVLPGPLDTLYVRYTAVTLGVTRGFPRHEPNREGPRQIEEDCGKGSLRSAIFLLVVLDNQWEITLGTSTIHYDHGKSLGLLDKSINMWRTSWGIKNCSTLQHIPCVG